QVYKSVNIEYDYFIRTTNEKHKQYVQKFIDQLFQQWNKGDLEAWEGQNTLLDFEFMERLARLA
ncbi:MAG: class I tRNA ligase family protein, partial [Sweet potato little leaf phytoplasma]|nr:class I tRNA ligase family protein [Sweet potato little leaf phytoplasma]